MLMRKDGTKAKSALVNLAGTTAYKAVHPRRGLIAVGVLLLPLMLGCENNDDPIENLRDSAEEVREGVEEAANDAQRKVEDLQD